MTNYESSNIKTLPIKNVPNQLKELYKKGRELNIMTEQMLKDIADNVCSVYNVQRIPITFAGTEPHKNRNGKLMLKVMGTHKRGVLGSTIIVYKYTAKQKKIRSSKGAISTLLHELVHYLDYEICGLQRSIHSKGFYNRISQLTEALKG